MVRPRRHLAITGLMVSAVAVMLASCAGAGRPPRGSSGSGTVSGSAGSCAVASASVYLSGARTVFTGTALPGPVAPAGSAGASLASPAHFRVIRYLKGSGPPVATVETAVVSHGNARVVNEDGIEPRAGQRWKIYTPSPHPPYQTSLCGGSCVMGGPGDGVNIPCGKEQGT